MKNFHYGWVMVSIAASILATHALVIAAFGIFLRPLTMEFDWGRGALSGAFSLGVLITGILGIVTGRLSDKYGPRLLVTLAGLFQGTGLLLMSQISSLWQVYLFWGLFVGITGGCALIPTLSTLPRWFTKRQGTAIAIAVTATGLGAAISPTLTQWLISGYGWRQSFFPIGLISFIIFMPLAQFMRHSPQRVGLKPYGENGTIEEEQPPSPTEGALSFTQGIRTSQFWIFALIQFCLLFTYMGVTVHIAPHAIDLGISAIAAASIVSTIGGSSVIGRLSIGFISDKVGGRLALSGCLILATLALMLLLFAKDIWVFYVFAIIFGVSSGGIIPLATIIPAELFGLRSLGIILGALMLLASVGGAIGPPLAGYIFDVTGNYGLAFVTCMIVCFLATILGSSLLRYKVKWE